MYLKVVKLTIFFCLIQPSFVMAQESKLDSILMDYNLFFKKMDQNFVDEINAEEFIVRVKKATVKQLDPHSHFYTKEESISRNNAWKGISYAGIGASVKESTNGVMIEYCKKGYGASKQGLLPGDIIIQIDSTNCKGLSFKQVISLLRGRNHSTVQVAVKRGEQKITRTIERKYIISKSISFADTISRGIGLIKVDQFLRGSGEEFRRQVKKVVEKGADKLIIDLRGNIGGLVTETVKALSAVLEKGTLVYTLKSKDKKSNYSDKTKSNPVNADLPLILIVDHKTISSGEIFCGTIQDLDRGVLLGKKTGGKGIVQGTRYFNDGSSLYITAARYHLPSGRCIQRTDYSKNYNSKKTTVIKNDSFESKNGRKLISGDGVTPDIKLDYSDRQLNILTAIEKSGLVFEFAVDAIREYGGDVFKNWKLISNDWIKFLNDNHQRIKLEKHIEFLKFETLFQDFKRANRKIKKLVHQLEKQKLYKINLNQELIKSILYQKLILFTSFNEGVYHHLSHSDLWIQQAIQILNSKETYYQTLNSN